jgi:uncharacterized protein (TIGR03435 family)
METNPTSRPLIPLHAFGHPSVNHSWPTAAGSRFEIEEKGHPMRFAIVQVVLLALWEVHAQTSPAPLTFEVASVKPSAPDAAGGGRLPMMREMMRNNRQPGVIPMTDPGRIRLENWALLDLIAAAYRVRATQVFGPSWLADQGFDIEAKVPGGAQKEQLNAMLQSLLEERFGLKVHRESQTKSGFALVVGKNGPKLEPAEPPPVPTPGLTEEEQKAKDKEQAQQHTAAMMKRMQERIQENRENGTPLGGISSASFDSITSEELAARLVKFAEAPVIDETGLTGKYSISIETWKNPDVRERYVNHRGGSLV